MQVKDALRQHAPHIEVNGGNYPTPASKVWLAQGVQVVQLSLIGMAVFGDLVLTSVLGYPTNGPFPNFYQSMREKKWYVGLGAWMVGNSIIQSVTSTGAFEIAYDGHLIYSKLNSPTHQLPSLQHILTEMARIAPLHPPPSHPNHRTSSASSRSSSSNRHAYTSAVHTDEQDNLDVNRDVHDMAYDEDRSA